MEKIEGMSQIVQCKNCEHKFLITNGNVTHEKEFKTKDGQSIYITYFDCPKCQERHYVQVDDQKSLGLKTKTLDLFQKLARLKIAKQSISKQQRKEFDISRKKLSAKRFELMQQYNDSIVTDTETGVDVHILFTVI